MVRVSLILLDFLGLIAIMSVYQRAVVHIWVCQRHFLCWWHLLLHVDWFTILYNQFLDSNWRHLRVSCRIFIKFIKHRFTIVFWWAVEVVDLVIILCNKLWLESAVIHQLLVLFFLSSLLDEPFLLVVHLDTSLVEPGTRVLNLSDRIVVGVVS